jgi:hypothetical protein
MTKFFLAITLTCAIVAATVAVTIHFRQEVTRRPCPGGYC